jgi:hypothetical protein
LKKIRHRARRSAVSVPVAALAAAVSDSDATYTPAARSAKKKIRQLS